MFKTQAIDANFKEIAGHWPYYVNREGMIVNSLTGREKKTYLGSGYVATQLTDYETKKRTSVLIHRVVLQTFGPEPGEGQIWVNHKDGNKLNNCIDNLEWSTPKEVLKKTSAKGLGKKLDATSVFMVKVLLQDGRVKQEDISSYFDISLTTIRQIVELDGGASRARANFDTEEARRALLGLGWSAIRVKLALGC